MAMKFTCDKCGEEQDGNTRINFVTIKMENDEGEHKSQLGGELCDRCRRGFIEEIQNFVTWPVESMSK